MRKIALLCVCCMAALSGIVLADPFIGERLEYEFGWKGFIAARAQVSIDAIEYNGEDCYNTEIKIDSYPKLDWIWKVRDRMISFARKKDLLPERFIYYQREGNFRLDTEILHDKNLGLLKSTRTRYKGDETKPYKPKQIEFGEHLDPVAALFHLRTQPLKVGGVYNLKVFDGKRSHDLTYTVVDQEKVTIKLGEFDAFKVIPRLLKSSGDREKSNIDKVHTVTMWVSTAPEHTILRIESKVWMGFVYAELVKK